MLIPNWLQQSIDSWSRTEPPGCTIAVMPASWASFTQSSKGKKASEANTAPCRSNPKEWAFSMAWRKASTLEVCPMPDAYSCPLNGRLVEERDLHTETADDFKTVTVKAPTEAEINDMIFANKVVKHSRSNAITLAKGGQLYASGIGQTSRVDALRQAIEKAHSFGFDLHGAVLASDAFFPFDDCVKLAHEAGITAIVQPGGSVRDQDSIDCCNQLGISMVFTGYRHFKH